MINLSLILNSSPLSGQRPVVFGFSDVVQVFAYLSVGFAPILSGASAVLDFEMFLVHKSVCQTQALDVICLFSEGFFELSNMYSVLKTLPYMFLFTIVIPDLHFHV